VNQNNKFQIIRIITIIVVILIFLFYRVRPALRKSELPANENELHSLVIVQAEKSVQEKI
jgi:hypothetical protein